MTQRHFSFFISHFSFSIALLLLTACGGQRTPQSWAERLQQEPAPDSIVFRYARLIHVEQREDCRIVYIDNPWKPGKTLHRYVLVGAETPGPPDSQYQGSQQSQGSQGSQQSQESQQSQQSQQSQGSQQSQPLPSATTIHVPLQRSVVFTSVHCALLDQLKATAQVAGVADLKYIKVPFVQEGVKSGILTDCGDGMSPLIEKIIDANADAILLSPFENAGGYGRLEDINIPIIECAEYMEQSPLARAEWMRFYGMLYGKEREADSLFHEIETHYYALKDLGARTSRPPLGARTSRPQNCAGETSTLPDAGETPTLPDAGETSTLPDAGETPTLPGAGETSTLPDADGTSALPSKPSVVMDKMAGSVWYVPGGRSTIGQMLADAGADYPWADDPNSGSLQLSFETVLERAGHCQLWLLRYDSPQPLTLSALLSEKDGYRMMEAVKQFTVHSSQFTVDSSQLAVHSSQFTVDSSQLTVHGVYACNVSTSMFYEETPFRPDLLLQDFIKILHPDIPNLPPLRYYHRVE